MLNPNRLLSHLTGYGVNLAVTLDKDLTVHETLGDLLADSGVVNVRRMFRIGRLVILIIRQNRMNVRETSQSINSLFNADLRTFSINIENTLLELPPGLHATNIIPMMNKAEN